MERIAELRARLADSTITPEELTELRALVKSTLADLRAGDLTTEVIAQMTDLATLAREVADAIAATAAAEAQMIADAEAAERAILDALGDDEGDDTDGEPEVIETTGEVIEVTEAEPERELVAASAAPVPARVAAPVVSRVAARRGPSIQAAAPIVAPPKMSLVAAANVPGITAGDSLDDPEKFTYAFSKALAASAGHRGATTNVPVATSRVEYPDAETLTDDLRGNMRKIAARTSPEAMRAYVASLPAEQRALYASGGACAPSTVIYDLKTLGSTERPVRDQMLVRFGADRGGVRIMPGPEIDDITTGSGGAGSYGITTWTAATDASPSSNTKKCLTVSCPSPTETLVDAIVRCIKFGNFQARFFTEQVDAWMAVAASAWARVAETKLLTAMGSGSTNVSVGQGLGTTRDVLAAIDRAAASLRSFHRIPRDFPLRFAFPGWLLDNMRSDLVRELPGSASERLAVADAELFRFFAVRNINPTAFLDGESGQVFAQQAPGALLAWPSTVVTYLYPEGTWLFLDGGTLDLGVVRDSTLNSTNDFQMFAETFENVAKHGVVSYRLSMDICPSGKTSAAASFDPCTTGS